MRRDHNRSGYGHRMERHRLGLDERFEASFVRQRHGGHGGHGGRGGQRGGQGGRGEGKRFFERGKFKFALLELLAAEPMHGYQLIKAMEQKTGGLYSPSAGSVYPNLQLLEDMGLIESANADGKKLYRITQEGSAYLREQAQSGADGEAHWKSRGHHRPHGDRHGKHLLKAMMKEWSDAVIAMAKASEAARAFPDSAEAAQFRELMTKLKNDLDRLLERMPQPEAADAGEGTDGSRSVGESGSNNSGAGDNSGNELTDEKGE